MNRNYLCGHCGHSHPYPVGTKAVCHKCDTPMHTVLSQGEKEFMKLLQDMLFHEELGVVESIKDGLRVKTSEKEFLVAVFER